MKLQTPWAQARRLAGQTPDSRNRFVDFMRAVSIGLVIVGHWLAAVSSIEDGQLVLTHVTNLANWTHWATWLFQVMPIFFIVGGYANTASWQSASRKGQTYELWIAIRLQRLIKPLIPLLIIWCAAAIMAYQFGINPQLFQESSRIALQPLWFLVVYLVLVLMTPVSYALWQRYGIKSFWGLACAVMVVDIIAFTGDVPLIRWINYVFVWLAVFQLGVMWCQRDQTRSTQAIAWAVGGLTFTIILVTVVSYPISMISVPGAEISNSRPPTIALLALAASQFGLLLMLDAPAHSWLRKPALWTATVLMNSTIMTTFLWHLTALAIVVSLSFVLGGYGMSSPPLSLEWWLSRPAWIAVLVIALLILISIFARFEQKAKHATVRPLPVWRAIVATVILCNGLALVALRGIGTEAPLSNQLVALLMVFLGSGLVLGRGNT